MEGQAIELVSDPEAPADRVEILVVRSVDGDLVLVEARHEVVGAGDEDVGAEHAGGAVETARVQVDERRELVARLIQELEPASDLVEALERVAFAREYVVDPVVALQVDSGQPHRPVLAERAADGAFDVD